MIAEICAAVCIDTTPDDVLDWLRTQNVEVMRVRFHDAMTLACNVIELGNDRVV